MKLPTKDENLVKIAQRIHSYRAFICWNFSKIFSFGSPHPHPCIDWGEIWCGGVDQLLRAKFHPNRCNISPPWAEKPQYHPWVTDILALCATRSAAGNYLCDGLNCCTVVGIIGALSLPSGSLVKVDGVSALSFFSALTLLARRTN